jgi:hypothetical protein
MATVADLLGKPLMPWQRRVADVALELLPGTDIPAYHTVVVVVMRQQGKTELMLPLMTHRAAADWGRPQRILYTAQTGSDARKKWEDIHVARLNKSVFKPMFQTRLRLNAEGMLWRDGSSWSPGAPTTKSGGTGDTINLAVIDEAWARPDNRQELAMRPAMLTQPDRQLWICSMVPGISRAKTVDSQYLRQKVAAGRRMVEAGENEGVAYFEWSADEAADPGDEATWWNSMPALGTTVGVKAVRDDYIQAEAEGKMIDWCAEYLGWWPQEHKPTWTIIRERTWDALYDPASAIAGAMAFAVDMDPDRNTAFIAAAGRREDGHFHVEIIEPGGSVPYGQPTIDWVSPRLVELIERWDPVAVVIDPRSPARNLLVDLLNRRIEVLTPNVQEVSGACARFYDLTGDNANDPDPAAKRVRHLGQHELTRAVAGARKRESPTYGTFD